jgi:hypothetical protein
LCAVSDLTSLRLRALRFLTLVTGGTLMLCRWCVRLLL